VSLDEVIEYLRVVGALSEGKEVATHFTEFDNGRHEGSRRSSDETPDSMPKADAGGTAEEG
jgi:hypothetical protein